MTNPTPLAASALRRSCDPSEFAFQTTDELEPLEVSIGQHRAAEAIRFGVAIRRDGYNLFAYGPAGTGKMALVRHYVEEQAATEPAPDDWCYVNNFNAPHKPRALRLPAGSGVRLRNEMERLVEDLRATISATFESEDYLARKHAIEEEFKNRHEEAFNNLQEKASQHGTALIRTPMGFAFAPVHNGEVVSPDVFRQWPNEHQEKVKATIAGLEKELQALLKQVPQWQRDLREKIRALDQEVTSFAVGHLMDLLRENWKEEAEVLEYFDEVQRDVVENAGDFMSVEPGMGEEGPAGALRRSLAGPPSFRRYQANVIVDHSKATAAPVVIEDHPTHPNLIGRIEHQAQFGALTTDFNLIKPGALHAANQGYLIFDARRLLMQPYSWEELKRAVRGREIRIQGVAESLGFAATISLDPEPIPLDVKIVLVGEPLLYYMLCQLDPDFEELFKVAVDFEDRFERTEENDALYARLVATIAKREELKAFDRTAVARIIDHASRLAADSEKLSLHMRPIADIMVEADHLSGDGGAVSAADVQRAIDGRIHRADRIRVRSYEEIERGTILIDVAGAEVGQVNGLSVLQLGGFAFGKPSRITAGVRLGRGEVVDIEREVELGGPLHSKGVMILTGFLGRRFGRARPLALSASLVFEQSYGGVDGDSASSAELYAMLSALSGIPIKQSFAVTGSVNQMGEVQAIGGVNEKIEGFFDVCAARELTGDQGVLIPASNVKHLMLRDDVIAAVEAGRFRVFPVETIDQGIEILTGVAAGEPDAEGEYAEGTVNRAVQKTLDEFASRARAFAGRADIGGGDNK
jgi:lon-related putative ATP-dependent protease